MRKLEPANVILVLVIVYFVVLTVYGVYCSDNSPKHNPKPIDLKQLAKDAMFARMEEQISRLEAENRFLKATNDLYNPNRKNPVPLPNIERQ